MNYKEETCAKCGCVTDIEFQEEHDGELLHHMDCIQLQGDGTNPQSDD